MVIETNLHLGVGIVRGNGFSLRRTLINVPSTSTVESATLTLKTSADDNNPNLFQKSITTTNTVDEGHVEDAGSSGVAVLRFDITSSNTLLMTAGTQYDFDIKVTMSDGAIVTIESGKVSARERVG